MAKKVAQLETPADVIIPAEKQVVELSLQEEVTETPQSEETQSSPAEEAPVVNLNPEPVEEQVFVRKDDTSLLARGSKLRPGVAKFRFIKATTFSGEKRFAGVYLSLFAENGEAVFLSSNQWDLATELEEVVVPGGVKFGVTIPEMVWVQPTIAFRRVESSILEDDGTSRRIVELVPVRE